MDNEYVKKFREYKDEVIEEFREHNKRAIEDYRNDMKHVRKVRNCLLIGLTAATLMAYGYAGYKLRQLDKDIGRSIHQISQGTQHAQDHLDSLLIKIENSEKQR